MTDDIYPDFEEEEDPDPLVVESNQLAWEQTNRPGSFFATCIGRYVPPPWLFEDFIRTNSLIMLSGEPFAGKSLFLMSLALHLELQIPLYNQFIPAPYQRVLYLGQDSPTWDYHAQMKKLFLGLVPDPETVKYMNSMHFFNRGFSISGSSEVDPRFFKWISEAVDINNFTVLMIDTLPEFHDAEENSNKEMGPIMQVLKDIRDKLGLTVFFTTHQNKSAELRGNYKARGATRIAGSCDSHFMISPIRQATTILGFRVKAAKGRGLSSKLPHANVLFREIDHPRGEALQLYLDPDSTDPAHKSRNDNFLSFISQPRSKKEILAYVRTLYPNWTSAQLSSRTDNTLRFLVSANRISHPSHGIYTPKEDFK